MNTRLEANPDEITKVHEVLKKAAPRGFTIETIEKETGCPNYIIYSAIRALKAKGVNVAGLDLFTYDPDAK